MAALPPRTRPVRSFVRRTGRLTEGQRRALDDLWQTYGLPSLPAQPARACGPGTQSCVLEIGFGNGEALIARATADPVRCYLGIDVHRPGLGRVLLEVARLGLANVRVLEADAMEAVRGAGAASLTEVCIWFPDPWPKKRHQKRRLIQPGFVAELRRILAPGGILHLATDDDAYAQHMAEVVSADGGFGPPLAEARSGRPVTRFERRALARGHRISDLRFQRVG